MSGSNPFSGLFDIEESKKTGNLNDILENIFRFTINPNKTYNQDLLYLEDVHNVHEKVDLDLSLLQYALFERLFLCNDNSDLRSDTESIQETKVITYLYHCMQNLNNHLGQLSSEQYEEVKDKILQNVATAIIQPDVYSGQNISEDILGILKNGEIGADVFFIESIKRVCIEDTSLDSLKFLVESINTIIVNELFKCSLTDVNPCIFNYFDTIPNYDILADVFIESCFPKKKNIGGEFALTVIGAILNHSVLPKTPVGKFIHFTNPMDQNEDIEQKHIHMSDMSTETCFLPVSSDDTLEEKRLMANSYNFVTECFFMAHRSIDLGFRVGVDKLIRQNHEMGRIQRAFNEALQQAGGNSDLVGTIKDRMSDELTKYLSLKCALSDPDMLQKMFDLISATSYWLCQVSVHRHTPESTAYAPLKELPVNFPLDTRVPDTLKCIPEFLVENIVSFLVFIRRFSQKSFEEQGYDKLSPILTFILVYMGSRRHMKNPHVRARLAEALESLLPFHKDEPQGNNIGGAQRRMLFNEHPHKGRIVENLMNVFVEIEMTGQSVEFEQKFNYRRPMYAVFDYLWEIPEHLDSFRQLAEEAETNMEAVNPPLFLKFSNLLINDAIFLLDEALANMAKLKEMQQAQDSGEWANMNVRERTQNISYMHHIGNLARFDNILGKDTIGMLEKLTSKINLVFTHSTMVDRIAAMLNYFLLNLVGPNKKNFKVKDAKEYHFDPADTVLEICKIYVNLKESDAFCLAVSQDGRSYSPNLFSLAEDVLLRIGGGPLIGELKEVANKVAEKANEYMANEEVLSEAPEHFLDPIMSTLMMDPVILPSSKQIVDRSTIARHLLSDQTDPFNRSPLSMDQIIPHTELAEEIRNWIDERKRKAGSQS
ncbi:ubiquitin conjugation factor E4 A isoform X2 [Diorhabda sublineata]|uniref:ubiquitin conjugation factor E4 A isoform X2 n=1 Tax=Diorhabda sublineata TaxID=1163346 RepID=UPI0024E13395|nr:ubiquitin conjugation factor E4 A isoform X2 [Diorhabda sublineata]